jgi:hypothetical protein
MDLARLMTARLLNHIYACSTSALFNSVSFEPTLVSESIQKSFKELSNHPKHPNSAESADQQLTDIKHDMLQGNCAWNPRKYFVHQPIIVARLTNY